MNQKSLARCVFASLLVLASVFQASPAVAQQTTAFTYQGQLRDGGTNANGAYTMVFALYDAVGGGNRIGSALTTSPTLANGLFSVTLDFGAGAFNGGARWLDITITAGGTTETLAPRVVVLPAPYAQFAAVAGTVTNGAIMNAQLAGNAVGTANIQNNAITTAQIASGAVTNQNLTANAVNATNIASGQVVRSLNGLTDNAILSAGANVSVFTNGNSLQFSAGVPNIQVFRNVSNATFTVPTNVTRIMVEMWGAGGGGGSGSASFSGGGGGAGAYTMNIFSVTPGSSFSVTAPGFAAGGQNGGTSSFSGNSISMTAGGGQAGANATAGGNGNGGTVGAAVGGMFQAGDNGQSGAQGGIGGGVWRGSPGSITGSSFAKSGPGGGGGGGGPGSPGNNGNSGLVFVYY